MAKNDDGMDDIIRPVLLAMSLPKNQQLDRDVLGRQVREAWIDWAMQQPDPKPSWLVSYDEMSEADKEADRRIGERIGWYVHMVLKMESEK